eukprot:180365_1
MLFEILRMMYRTTNRNVMDHDIPTIFYSTSRMMYASANRSVMNRDIPTIFYSSAVEPATTHPLEAWTLSRTPAETGDSSKKQIEQWKAKGEQIKALIAQNPTNLKALREITVNVGLGGAPTPDADLQKLVWPLLLQTNALKATDDGEFLSEAHKTIGQDLGRTFTSSMFREEM